MERTSARSVIGRVTARATSWAAVRVGLRPNGLGVEAVRPIRDQIEQRVRRLLAELEIPATA
jgi:hypothetical protein